MNAPDLHTLTGAYAADALDPGEREDFKAHLRDCASCREEVAELAATSARLALAVAGPAPPGLRARVLAEAARTRQHPPRAASVVSLSERRVAWWRQPASAAAAVLLVVSLGLAAVAVSAERAADRAEERAARIAAIALDPDAVRTVVPISGGGTGTVVVADGSAAFRTTGLRELAAGKVYQLWVIDPVTGPQSAGVLGGGGALQTVVGGVDSGDGLGLTIEPAGGSPTPTGDLLLSIDLA